jgi:gamma-glutamyltranspeptidase/glutathione hydrolase
MDDFTIRAGTPNLYGLVQGEANAIAPGKRPLSSMAPTIVLKDGRVFLVLGSPGGSRIITITLQTILNLLDHGMDPQEAVDAPRLHHQWMPDLTILEPDTLSADTEALLRAQGHNFRIQRPWGSTELIAIGPATPTQRIIQSSGGDGASAHPMRPGLFYGASDSRRPAGLALGP